MTDRTFRSMVVGLSLLAVLVFALAYRFHYRVRSTYACPDCLSRKHVYQWRLGLWPNWSVPLTGEKEVLAQSVTFMDFYPVPISTVGNSCRNLLTTFWQPNRAAAPWAMAAGEVNLQDFPDFREFILGKITSQVISKEQTLQLLTMPVYLTDAQNNDAHLKELSKIARDLTDEFYK